VKSQNGSRFDFDVVTNSGLEKLVCVEWFAILKRGWATFLCLAAVAPQNIPSWFPLLDVADRDNGTRRLVSNHPFQGFLN
jgi:hypothetical protein